MLVISRLETLVHQSRNAPGTDQHYIETLYRDFYIALVQT